MKIHSQSPESSFHPSRVVEAPTSSDYSQKVVCKVFQETIWQHKKLNVNLSKPFRFDRQKRI